MDTRDVAIWREGRSRCGHAGNREHPAKSIRPDSGHVGRRESVIGAGNQARPASLKSVVSESNRPRVPNGTYT